MNTNGNTVDCLSPSSHYSFPHFSLQNKFRLLQFPSIQRMKTTAIPLIVSPYHPTIPFRILLFKMLPQNQIITCLQKLSHLDAFIFLFYYNDLLGTDTHSYWPSKVGSRVHFECLKRQAEASDIPYITDEILPEIERIKLNTFSGKSKRMVSMAEMS